MRIEQDQGKSVGFDILCSVRIRTICLMSWFQEHFRLDRVLNSNRTQLWNLLKMRWKVPGAEGRVRQPVL